MLTQCQQCKKSYSVSLEELCRRSTPPLCPNCEEMTDRLMRYGDDLLILSEEIPKPGALLWTLGFCAGILSLCVQVYHFEWPRLSQEPQSRIWMIKLCTIMPCELPAYKNSAEFEVLYSAFQPTPNNHYMFHIVISNQAQFAQPYPQIKLTLLDFTGTGIGERIFKPVEYLPASTTETIAAAETIEVSLAIAAPTQKIGGYAFDLIFATQ